MSTSVIAANTFEAACVGGPKAVDGGTSFDLVKAFGGRVFSIAKHITQNDDAAEDVLIETFLEVCPDLGGCQEDEESWLRLVTLAVRGAFSKLHNRGEGRPFLDPVADPCEDLVIREFFVWEITINKAIPRNGRPAYWSTAFVVGSNVSNGLRAPGHRGNLSREYRQDCKSFRRSG